MIDFEFHQASDLDHAFALLADYGDDARLMSGGTALVLQMKQRFSQPGHVIGLRRIPGLGSIEKTDAGAVRIGALCTQRQVENHPLVAQRLPLVAGAYRHVATPRIRNMATVGGGLAHGDPNQDPPPSLIALGASVVLSSAGGEERIVAAEDLFVDYFETDVRPGEIITGLVVPPAPEGSGAAYLKFLPRTADDYATVSVAVVVTPDEAGNCGDIRIVLGSVGLTPIRATAAEDALRGQPLNDETMRAAAATVQDAVDPLEDHRGSTEYKREMAEVFTRRAVRQAMTDTGMV
ncbi:MAG: xanthine dehydrogenase family protein subunit M [Chloroflexota bacterium]|nr:xanthine dehydrogenase family protein subunit M [Chloroflexota bacterium]